MLEGGGLWDKEGLFVFFLEKDIASFHDFITFSQPFLAVGRLFFFFFTTHFDCLSFNYKQ